VTIYRLLKKNEIPSLNSPLLKSGLAPLKEN